MYLAQCEKQNLFFKLKPDLIEVNSHDKINKFKFKQYLRGINTDLFGLLAYAGIDSMLIPENTHRQKVNYKGFGF